MDQKKSTPNLNSIEKCLQILSTFTHDRSELSVNDISRKYQFNPSTVYRILNHLEDFGYSRVTFVIKRHQPHHF